VGGRTRSRRIAGNVVELGGQFISNNHARMRALAADAGLHLTREGPGPVRWRGPEDQIGQLIPNFAPADFVALRRVLFGSHSLRRLPRAATFEFQRFELNSRTLADKLQALPRPSTFEYLMSCLLSAFFGGADPSDISLLEFAELIGREGGAFRFLIGEIGFASYVVEGSGALCTHLAGTLAAPVHLEAVTSAVESDSAVAALHIDNGEVIEADHVIIAIPAAVLPQIDFTPSLPAPIADANSDIHYGEAIKVAAVVPHRKLTQAKAFVGGQIVFAGWRTRQVLYGYAAANAGQLDSDTLAADLCRGFALDPQDVEHVEVVRWPQQRLTGGTVPHIAPRRFTEFRRSLPHSHARVHFAGAERSSWPIYMEGAVESGDQAAHFLDR
jgi:monoamine oxidase